MPLDGTLFVLALHGTTPACEAWTATPTQLAHTDERVEYHLDHDQLVIETIYRGESSTTCSSQLTLVESDDGYDVEGARWFRTKAACQAAIAHHRRVAMRWPCDDDEDVPTEVHDSTRRRFDDVLAYGAILYREGDCNRVRFEASKPARADRIEGSLFYAIVVDGVHGIEGYDYEGKRGGDTLTLSGPGTTMDDGVSSATGCSDDISLVYSRDHVSVMGNLYFDRASCRAATERAQYRDSWWPTDTEQAGLGHQPLAGGC